MASPPSPPVGRAVFSPGPPGQPLAATSGYFSQRPALRCLRDIVRLCAGRRAECPDCAECPNFLGLRWSMSCLHLAHGQSVPTWWDAYSASQVRQRCICVHGTCCRWSPSFREHHVLCTSSFACHATRVITSCCLRRFAFPCCIE